MAPPDEDRIELGNQEFDPGPAQPGTTYSPGRVLLYDHGKPPIIPCRAEKRQMGLVHTRRENFDRSSTAKTLGHKTMPPGDLDGAQSAISAYNSGIAISNFRT